MLEQQGQHGIIISDMKQRCAQAQSTFPMLSRREKQRVLLGPSTPMSHPMDLSRMRKQEIINEFRKLEIVKCLLEDWIENGGGMRFGKTCPVCMCIEYLKVIKSCACDDADPRPCRCFICRAEYSFDSGDTDRGSVGDIEWWERDDPPDSLGSGEEDARMKKKKKKRMHKQPKKTSKPKKANKRLKKQSH